MEKESDIINTEIINTEIINTEIINTEIINKELIEDEKVNESFIINFEDLKIEKKEEKIKSEINYAKLNKDELKAICKELKIKGISKKTKQELINMIKEKYETFDKKEKEVKISGDILSSEYWKKTKAFKSIKDKETQIKYYRRMKSSEEVLQLVDLDSKPFGSASEKIIQEIFKLGPRTSSQNDGTRNGKKIEIKSARYWAGKDDCIWQHLEPEHDYEYVLFVLLDFHSWKVWCIKKSFLMEDMREKKILTFQGKQGWWVKKSSIISYLTPINNIEELDTFIQS